MNPSAYTLAMYRVRAGEEQVFIDAWRALLATFSQLPEPPLWATLIRSTADSTLFYSFGPWRDPAHVQAMRGNEAARSAFARIAAVCSEMTPANYELVAHVDVARG